MSPNHNISPEVRESIEASEATPAPVSTHTPKSVRKIRKEYALWRRNRDRHPVAEAKPAQRLWDKSGHAYTRLSNGQIVKGHV